MRAKTRVYFAVSSDLLSPGQLTEMIGVEPSSVVERGSKRAVPPIPATNTWRLDSGLDRSAAPAEHLAALLTRIAPAVAAIAKLCKGEPVARLEIVREFRLGHEEADLGFALDRDWLHVISQTGAFVDIDEYDLTAGGDSQYRQRESEAETLAAVGAALQGQPSTLTMRLPADLAEQAVAAWRRDDTDGLADPESEQQRTARHAAGTVALIGQAIEQTGRPDGDQILCELDAWHIGAALEAADERGLIADGPG